MMLWFRIYTIGMRLLLAVAMTLATCGVAIAEAEAVGDPDLPWLDNRWYKINLDVRARIELADIDGFENSEAYTLRTRVGLEAKPYYGFSALAELENTWSPASGDYFDGASTPNGKSVIADPENTELNRIWAQYAEHKFLGTSVSVKAKGGIQRIIFDDARFIGNVGWRQNEQTFDAALGESNLSIDGLTAQYAYLWRIQRIFGDQGPNSSTHDYQSDSHIARIHYAALEGHNFTGFIYNLDFKNDSPGDSSTSFGVRAAGRFPLEDDWSLGYSASYAYQTDAAKNPESYDAHYIWGHLDIKLEGLGQIGATYELLGSDDGGKQFVTPLATAHKFNGWADAFLDNGGPKGLQDLFFSVSPILPWKLKSQLVYHEFWRADGGTHLGSEFDALLSRPFNQHLTGLTKFAWFDGKSRGPADRWRMWFQLEFKY